MVMREHEYPLAKSAKDAKERCGKAKRAVLGDLE